MSSHRSSIVIVSGMPRSGTSMVMQMIAAGGLEVVSDGARAPDAHNPRGYLEDERVKSLAKETSWLGEAQGKVLKVVSPLLRFLPNCHCYKVLFVQRAVPEIVASQISMLTASGQSPPDIQGKIRLEKACRMSLLRTHDWLAEQACMECCFVAFEDILSDPQGQSERLSTFLGRSLDVEAMVGVVEPALRHCKPTRRT